MISKTVEKYNDNNMTNMDKTTYCPPSIEETLLMARYPLLVMSEPEADIEDFEFEDLGIV